MKITLTPNQRMARFLSQKTEDYQVLPIEQWLETIFLNLLILSKALNGVKTLKLEHLSLLTDSEELILWENIISTSEQGVTLLKTRQTAKLVRDAFYLSQQWHLKRELEDALDLPSFDVLAFREWSKTYRILCEKEHYIDRACLPDAIIDLLSSLILSEMQSTQSIHLEKYLKSKNIHFPKTIQLMGFEELTPQLKHFFAWLSTQGITVTHQSLLHTKHNIKNNKVVRLKVVDVETEYRLAAQCAQLFLQSKIQTHAKTSMAIVVPNLSEERDRIVRILAEMLPEGSYNVSAPKSLASYPIIQAALLILQLSHTEIKIEELSQILQSPFLGEAISEMSARAMLDIELRERNEPSFYWQNIVEYLSEKSELCNLKTLLTAFLSIQPQLKGKKNTEEWVLLIQALLKAWDWPGQRTVNHAELEIKIAFEETLNAYQELGRVLGNHTYWQAISRFREKLLDTSFAQKTKETPIQVLGVLEASGLPFEKLWVTGLQRNAWPAEARPNPFIPIALQKQHDTPRSTAQRELRVATRTIEQFSLAANAVIFSYPSIINEESTAETPLIQHLPEVTLQALGLNAILSSVRLNSRIATPSFIMDERGPVVDSAEKNLGGTKMLKLQALCPFRAFAEIRLNARPFPFISVGLNPAERGIIIHEILQHFYTHTPNQHSLKSYSDAELMDRLRFSVDTVLKRWQKKKPKTLTSRYLRLEQERIIALLSRFIELDKERSPFRIIQQEKEVIITLSDIQLKIRLDRVDQLESGEEILIDYKTSDIALRHWFSERSEEPQLPLYSVTRNGSVSGLVFAIIRPDKTQYIGLSKEKSDIPGTKTIDKLKSSGAEATWEIQHDNWKTALSQLAKDFSEGIAHIDPKHNEGTCRQCHLKLLCRVDFQKVSLTREDA